jgi:hypothetical protein
MHLLFQTSIWGYTLGPHGVQERPLHAFFPRSVYGLAPRFRGPIRILDAPIVQNVAAPLLARNVNRLAYIGLLLRFNIRVFNPTKVLSGTLE